MTDIRQRTDGELLDKFANTGSEEAFAELVGRHGPMVHGVCRRVLADHHEAQDVAQAVFLTLARKAGSMRKDPSVGGWLQHVALCLARNVRESRLSREKRESEAMRENTQVETSTVERQEFRTEVDAAVAALPERYRLPVVLFHLEERSLDETARQLDLNVSTAGNRLARAREMLRKKLVRRGVTVGSVGALTSLLSAEAGAAVLPATFISATVKAAGLAVAGKLAAGVGAGAISANVAGLTKGAVNMLFWSSVKTAVVAVAVTGVVVGTGTVVAQKAMEATPVATVASRPKTMDLPSLVRLRREQNLLTGEWICPTNPADLGNFETVNPPLSWSAGGRQSERGQSLIFTIYGTNMTERTGSGIWHLQMTVNAGTSNFWVMVMYGTKAPIACIEYIQSEKELRLIRTVWAADGRLDPEKRLDIRTGPNIEELKAKAGEDLRNYLAPVLAMITPGDLIGQQDDLPDYEMWPFQNRAELPQQEQESLQKADEAFARGKCQEAIALYNGLVAVNPKSPAIPYALVLKGRCQDKIGSMKAAAAVYREVLDYFPNNADFAAPSLFYLARIAAKEKDFRQSLRDLAVLEMDKLYNTHDVMPTAHRLKIIVEKLAGAPTTVTRFTEADNGKTVTVPVGQMFQIVLLNGREGAGWEPGATEITGQSVECVDKLRRGNCDSFTAEKAPTPDSTVGMYVYRYKAAALGISTIRLTHLYPSGPTPRPRNKTQFVGEFKLTVLVKVDTGATTVSAVAPGVLCGNLICAQKVNMANGIHDCPNCRKVKTNLAHKFCPDCARQLSVCMICGKALGPEATALIDPFKSGDYASGKWSYHYIVVEKGPQTGYRQGFLKYDGREILSPQPNDYIATPWGWMQWHDRELKAGNWFRVEEPRGWKPGKDEFWPGTPREERMKYRLLPDPATHPEVLTNPPTGR